jgi:16S rRNA (cytidine1402-2'-O)-methyltransferase
VREFMGKLYVVATPIGNLKDMSQRSIEVLKSVDLIAAEDTRTSKVLMDAFNINNKLISNHKFNEGSKVKSFINDLLNGKNIAIISDAGTPCVSDPGYVLVSEAIKNNIEVIGIPGASAVTTAISISGFEALSFTFYGFLPKEKKDILKFLNDIKSDHSKVLVFYESPKRIIKSLVLMSEVFNNSNVCVCNDLTKKFEKIYRGNIIDVIKELKENKSYEKGEYTIVLEKKEAFKEENNIKVSLEALIIDYVINNKCSVKEAITKLSENYNKNELYKASLVLKGLLN